MSDLDEKEQKHVRVALRHLHRRTGTWAATAEALRCAQETLKAVMRDRYPVSASLAFRVARLADVPIDDLLAGRFLPPGACPHCGHVPDFSDEPTQVQGVPRPADGNGLKLVT